MHRSQILLEDWQYETMKVLSKQKGISMSEFIRSVLSDYLQTDKQKGLRLEDIEGIGSDSNCTGEHHDRILYSS